MKILQQEGVLAGGRHVALTGNVYALATAANEIKKGFCGEVQVPIEEDAFLLQRLTWALPVRLRSAR